LSGDFVKLCSCFFFLSLCLFVLFILPGRTVAGTGIDSLGNRVTAPGKKARIVSLSPGATETLYALGVRDAIVGISDYCNYPPDFVRNRQRMGGFSTPNIERIEAAQPDVVILGTVVPLKIKRQLDSLGVQSYVYNPKTYRAFLDSVYQFGRMFSCEEEAGTLIQSLQDDAADIVQNIHAKSTHPVRTFIEIFDDPLYGAGRNTLPGDIVTMAGGRVVPEGDQEYPRLNEEQLLILNPEAIVLGHEANLVQFLSKHGHVSGIIAIRNRKILIPDPDQFLRPGPRVINALRDIAQFLHPEAFQ
jgi:iron complex transport system substrate-binding protein